MILLKKTKNILLRGSLSIFIGLGFFLVWQEISPPENTLLFSKEETLASNTPILPVVSLGPWDNFLQQPPLQQPQTTPIVSKKQTLIFRVHTNISTVEESLDTVERSPFTSSRKAFSIFPIQAQKREFLKNEEVLLFKIPRKISFP